MSSFPFSILGMRGGMAGRGGLIGVSCGAGGDRVGGALAMAEAMAAASECGVS